MWKKDGKVALALRSKEELDFFSGILKGEGYTNLEHFPSTHDLYEKAVRVQYEFFVIRVEMEGMPGVVIPQKLRETGNYGLETYFFIGDSIDDTVFSIFTEYDISYVLVKPFSPDRIVGKLEMIEKSENSLSEFETAYREARAAYYSGLVDMAHENAVSLLEQDPKMEKVQILVGDIELQRGQISSARRSFRNALMINPKSAAAANKLALTYMKEKNFEKASEITNKLATLNPLNIKILVNAGISNLEIGNLKKSKEHMDQLVKIDSENDELKLMRAKLDVKEGKFAASCEDLKDIGDQKDIVSFYNNSGVDFARQGKVDEAIKLYETCVENFSQNPFIYVINYNLGLAYKRKKMFEEAISHLKMSIYQKPEFERAQKALKELMKNKVA